MGESEDPIRPLDGGQSVDRLSLDDQCIFRNHTVYSAPFRRVFGFSDSIKKFQKLVNLVCLTRLLKCGTVGLLIINF